MFLLYEGKTCSVTNDLICGISIICGGEPFEDALKGKKFRNSLGIFNFLIAYFYPF